MGIFVTVELIGVSLSTRVMKVHIKQLLLASIIATGFAVFGTSSVNAVEEFDPDTFDSSSSEIFEDAYDSLGSTECGQPGLRSLTGTLRVPEGEYKVYVRLGIRGQRATVFTDARYNDSFSSCQSLGSVEASGDTWTQVGSVYSVGDEFETRLQLQSESLGDVPTANRPSYLLLPAESNICDLKGECEVTVDGQVGFIRPPGSSPSQDSVRIVRIVDPSEDVLVAVRYYVDGDFVYETTDLEQFNKRFASRANQKLTRVAEYASGQRIVFEGSTSESFVGSFENYAFQLWSANKNTIIWTLISAGVLLAVLATKMLVGAIQKRMIWRESHGFTHQNEQLSASQTEQRYTLQRVEKILQISFIIGVAILGSVLVGAGITRYGLATYTIEGDSMNNTYSSGKTTLANKLPVTLANLNNNSYQPNRGDVVVAEPQYGILDASVDLPEGNTVIKRVIALPGERIVIRDGEITVYNSQNPDGFNPDEGTSWSGTMIKDTTKGLIDITLSESEVFLTGDNRPGSVDSRYNGPIDTRQIVGPVLTVF